MASLRAAEHLGALHHKGSPPLDRFQNPSAAQFLDGLPHRHPAHAKGLGQLILGGDHVSLLVDSVGDVLGYLVEDLRVNGSGSAVSCH